MGMMPRQPLGRRKGVGLQYRMARPLPYVDACPSFVCSGTIPEIRIESTLDKTYFKISFSFVVVVFLRTI